MASITLITLGGFAVGGTAGALIFRKHRVAGGIAGALIVGVGAAVVTYLRQRPSGPAVGVAPSNTLLKTISDPGTQNLYAIWLKLGGINTQPNSDGNYPWIDGGTPNGTLWYGSDSNAEFHSAVGTLIQNGYIAPYNLSGGSGSSSKGGTVFGVSDSVIGTILGSILGTVVAPGAGTAAGAAAGGAIGSQVKVNVT